MALPVHRRQFDAFLSHAHADRNFVDELYRWLGEIAGLNIWYDAKKMVGGEGIGSGLQTAIEECRGLLLVASPEAITRGWVKAELDIARVEQADSPDYRIVPLQLAKADVASLIKGQSWIEVPTPTLNGSVAASIIRAFYPGDNRPDPRTSRDVYVSGSWQSDNASALGVFRSLCESGFRLIGDAKDQKGFKINRVQSIVESCGAFVGVIPYRDNNSSASASERPYKYFLSELDFAIKANLPTLVIADPQVHRIDGEDQTWLRMDTQASQCPSNVQNAINELWDRWVQPPHPHYIFLAIDLALTCSGRNSDLRELIERITGMPTIVGNEIREPDLQSAIMRSLKDAFLVIADISGATESTFNVDCCIEAGMTIASETNLALVARGKPHSPPFMLRHAGQLITYADEVEQLGAIHSIVREYRRRIINAELSRYQAARPD
jgi:TIR domain